jgi:hypothetical protein
VLLFHIAATWNNHGVHLHCSHSRRGNAVTAARIFRRGACRRRSAVPRLSFGPFSWHLPLYCFSPHLLVLMWQRHRWWTHVGLSGRLIVSHANALDLTDCLLTPRTVRLAPVVKLRVLTGSLTVPGHVAWAWSRRCQVGINLHGARLSTGGSVGSVLDVVKTFDTGQSRCLARRGGSVLSMCWLRRIRSLRICKSASGGPPIIVIPGRIGGGMPCAPPPVIARSDLLTGTDRKSRRSRARENARVRGSMGARRTHLVYVAGRIARGVLILIWVRTRWNRQSPGVGPRAKQAAESRVARNGRSHGRQEARASRSCREMS